MAPLSGSVPLPQQVRQGEAGQRNHTFEFRGRTVTKNAMVVVRGGRRGPGIWPLLIEASHPPYLGDQIVPVGDSLWLVPLQASWAA